MNKMMAMPQYDPNDFTKLASDIFDESVMFEYKKRFIDYTNKKIMLMGPMSSSFMDKDNANEPPNNQEIGAIRPIPQKRSPGQIRPGRQAHLPGQIRPV